MAQNQKIKNDAGKPRLAFALYSLIIASGIVRDEFIMRTGQAYKSWRWIEPIRWLHAFARHTAKFMKDPDSIDEESGLPHLYHMITNLGFLAEIYQENGTLKHIFDGEGERGNA